MGPPEALIKLFSDPVRASGNLISGMSVPLGSAGGSAQIIFGPISDYGILFSEFPFPLRAAGGSLRMTFGPTGPFVSLFWSSQIFNSNSRSIVLKTIY